MRIGDQASQHIYKIVYRTTVTRMLNLRDVLELIDDGFDDGPFTKQDLVSHGHQAIFHVAAQLCDQLKIEQMPKLLKQRLRDIASIAK
mgnify:CR=1 FL=1